MTIRINSEKNNQNFWGRKNESSGGSRGGRNPRVLFEAARVKAPTFGCNFAIAPAVFIVTLARYSEHGLSVHTGAFLI